MSETIEIINISDKEDNEKVQKVDNKEKEVQKVQEVTTVPAPSFYSDTGKVVIFTEVRIKYKYLLKRFYIF